MNIDNKNESVNKYLQWSKDWYYCLDAIEKAETRLKENPEDKDALEDLKAAKISQRSLSERQDRMLEEITQTEMDEFHDLYQRAEANISVLDLTKDQECKYSFLAQSYRNKKIPPNVNPDIFEEEVIAEDGLPTILDFHFKLDTILCVWDEQHDKIHRNKMIYRDIKRFFDANNWPIEKTFGYKNQEDVISAIRNPKTYDDDFFAGIVSWHIGYYCDDLIEDDDLKSEKNSVEILQPKIILDKCQSIEDYDPSHLPPLLYDFIDEKCKETAADPIIITQSAVCSASALIGKKACIPFPNYFNSLYGCF